MQKKLTFLLLAVILSAVFLTGCSAPEQSEEQTPAEQPAEENLFDAGISVNGTAVEAAGKTVNLYDRNAYVQKIKSCRWLEKNKIAVQCTISGGKSQDYYFAVYDVVRDLYVYEQYGKQFIWQNDDLDTLVYVLDYAEEGQPSRVCSRLDVVLYESAPGEQVLNVSFVPKGIRIELADLRGENPRQVIVEAVN